MQYVALRTHNAFPVQYCKQTSCENACLHTHCKQSCYFLMFFMFVFVSTPPY